MSSKMSQSHEILDVQKWALKLKGIFTVSDLKTILRCQSRSTFFQKINRLEKLNVISRFSRTIYLTDGYSSEDLSSRLNSNSYISFGTVLAQHMLIGSIPTFRVQSVKTGKSRVYSNEHLTIEHLSIQKKLYFGFESDGWIKKATPEKAYLDTLYFAQKGKKFSFDPYSDVDISKLNMVKINEYLKSYSLKFNNYYHSLDCNAK